MKPTITTLILTLLFSVQLTAQTLSGKVTDEQNQPIEFANVALFILPDSSLITGTVTNANGEFSFEKVETKNAFLRISFIGYETRTVPATSGLTIALKSESTQLGEVVVSGTRKAFRMQNGSIVADVKNTILETLPTANDVIAQLPFLSGKDGNFTVFGKGTPIIYINNRLVRNNKELEQLSPSDIKSIQVITSPGAQYDASVKSVIKITTAKPVGEGLSGMLYAQGKQNSVFSGSEYVSLNYRTGAWDVFGSAYYIQNRYKTDFKATQEFLLPNNEQKQIYRTFEDGGYDNIIPVLGVNYNPNANHSTGIRYTYDNAKWDTNVKNDIIHSGNNIAENVNQYAHFLMPDRSHKVNAYYNGAISEKISLHIDGDWVKGDEQHNMNSYFSDTPTDILQTNATRDYDLYAGKGVLSYALGKGTLEAGGEYTYTRFLQTYTVNKPELGIENSNDKAIQNRGALFVTYQTQIGKIGLNGGLRYENIDMDYFENDVLNKEQSKKYSQFFPNLSISYSHNMIQTVVGFERKINYPAYSQLRSNVQYSSPFLYESGNPLLQPKIENSFSAMFAWRNVQAMAGYSINENDIVSFLKQFNNEPIVLFRPENVKRTQNANFGISYSPAFGVWRPQFEVGGMWQWLRLEGENREYDKPMYSAKWNNTFTFPQDWTLRLNADGHAGGHNGVTLLKPSWGIDFSVSKRFLNKQLNVNLSANDIFKTRTNKWEMNYGKVNFFYDKNIDSRSISLTVSYRFNSTNSKYKGQQASDEINRL